MSGNRFKKGTLAAVVGLGAAALLYSSTPEQESGRKVSVSIADDGTATVRHVSGPQYLRAYRDIAGVATACDGITKGVKMGQVYTEAQCNAKLERELVVHAEGVMRCSPALVKDDNDWRRIAAVDHGYQFGVAAWCGSTAHRLIEQGKIAEGCADLLRWNKAGGRFSNGVQRRSYRRMEYCRTGLPGFPASTLPARLKPWM
jgi:lysozyme